MTISDTQQTDECQEQLTRLADKALDAFWEVIVQHYPQAKSGDLSPWATMQLQTAAENAIEEWISNNVPATSTSKE